MEAAGDSKSRCSPSPFHGQKYVCDVSPYGGGGVFHFMGVLLWLAHPPTIKNCFNFFAIAHTGDRSKCYLKAAVRTA